MNGESEVTARTARFVDVCNGDADGLCAVVQWRLSRPAAATLVTGLKRDIELLERVHAAAGDEVLVCDISMQRNRDALSRLLALGVRVRYFDHHGVIGIPTHPCLESHIELGPEVCTSLLVDRHLHGAFRSWALVGAYGDNLGAVADALAEASGLRPAQRARLRMLGVAINYNAYGETLQDVTIAPAQLYRIMARYADPLALVEHEAVILQLERRRRCDLVIACAIAPLHESPHAAVRVLPGTAWGRRVIGSLAHELAAANPGQAQAVLRSTAGGHFVASVRAPHQAPFGASEFCARFGGAGRSGAAGIDRLPAAELDRFVAEFESETWAPH